MTTGIRVGYVPEHFSTPLHFAFTKGFFRAHGLEVELIPFPSGTGHMIKSLDSHDIAIAIGLTEGWIAALANGNKTFKIVGKYVSTPLCWAISTGRGTEVESVNDLKGGKIGISRVGSGSYVMAYVLAQQRGWLPAPEEATEEDEGREEPFEFKILDDFKGLRDGVNSGTADAFMWEYFTSKRYYDSGEIRQVGEIYTPWPSWHIVASVGHTTLPPAAVPAFLNAVNEGIAYFNGHKDEAVEYITKHLDYSADDARGWLRTVAFTEDVRAVDGKDVDMTVEVLVKAGVVKNLEGDNGYMVAGY